MPAIRKSILIIVAVLLTAGPSAGAFQSTSPVDIVVAYKDYVNAPVKGVKGACSNCFPVEGALVTLTFSGATSPLSGVTAADGHIVFSLPMTVTTVDLKVQAAGFVTYDDPNVTVQHRRPTDRWAVLLEQSN